MINRKLNSFLFAIESAFFGGGCIAFLILNFFFDIPDEYGNILYITFILISFGWLFAYEFIFKKFDNAVHFKMFEKYFVPTKKAEVKTSYKRKGLVGVIILWIAYLIFIFAIKMTGFLTWELFLAGAGFMFLLNSFFTRKKCLLSVIFLHNKNHCCKNCGINSWDYLIFASALIFAPDLSILATIINYQIIAVSTVMLIVWEYNYKKHPVRFYQETNKALSCKNCLKQCHSNVDKKLLLHEVSYEKSYCCFKNSS